MSVTAFAFAALLIGQDPPLPVVCDVEAEVETPECRAALQAQLLEMFGATSIEAEAASGARVHRAFIANGNGRDMLLVSFEMRRDQSPTVVLRGRGGRFLSHPVSAEVWDRVADEGVYADRDLGPPPAYRDGEVRICVHPWSATVEMANALNSNYDPTPFRSRSDSSCQPKSLVFRYAFLLAELAADAIPACDQLDPEEHRNDASRLEACLNLAGNTVAAASLMNEKGDPPYAYSGRPITTDLWAEWLLSDTTAVLDWNGQVRTGRVGGSADPRIELSEIVQERTAALSGLRIYQSVIGAHSPEEGWIEGQMLWSEPGAAEDDPMRVAAYRQEWSRTPGGRWRLRRWTVGPDRPFRPSE